MDDDELRTAVSNCAGDTEKLMALVRKGGKVSVPRGRCEWCNQPTS